MSNASEIDTTGETPTLTVNSLTTAVAVPSETVAVSLTVA